MNKLIKILGSETRRPKNYKRLRKAKFNKTTASVFMSLVMLCAIAVPKTALSQDCVISDKGTVEQGVFDGNTPGNDYKITCSQAQDPASIDKLVAKASGLIVDQSKILIELSNGNKQIVLNHETAAYEIILKGTITDDGVDSRVISVSNYNEQRGTGIVDGVIVENRATIEATGNGRRGFLIEGYDGADVEFTNYGTITTSGDVYQRPDASAGAFPNRRSDGAHVTTNDASGDVTLINRGTVKATGKAARGLTGGVAGINHDGSQKIQSSGSVTIKNFGQVTTEGDAHEFEEIRDVEAEAYRSYGLHAYLSNSTTGTIDITNEAGATVTTKGLGSRGISAYSDGSGAVTVTNKGTVTNTGGAWKAESEDFISRPYGLQGQAAGGGAVTVLNEGTVTTGDEEEIKKAETEELGKNIEISGTHGNALMAVTEGATPGLAQVINRGAITTWGYNAHGMATYVDDDDDRTAGPSGASGENSGTITTHGDQADGASIIVLNSQDERSSVEVTNLAGGTVTTNGAGSEGIEALFWMSRGEATEDALGTARGTNHGTVTTTGAAAGVNVGFWANQADENKDDQPDNFIENSGNAFVENTGTVTVSGHGSVGLNAQTHGEGNVDIKVQNGIVRAGTLANPDAEPAIVGKFGIGIQGRARTASPNSRDQASDTDIDVIILVSGSSAIVQAYGADADDDTTDEYDESKGIAILADSGGDTGHSVVQIEDGATVSAFGKEGGSAVKFEGGKGTLNLINSSLVGNISFTDGDYEDAFNIRAGSGSIDGDIKFSDGNDEMEIDIAPNQHFVINGDIMGLETMNKIGEGSVRLNGDVEFEGSTLNLDNGLLIIAGYLDLKDGVLTVKEAAKLAFEIAGVDEGQYGSLTAGTLKFEGTEASVQAYIAREANEAEVKAALQGVPLKFLENRVSVTADGSDARAIAIRSETAPVGSIVIATGQGQITEAGTLTLSPEVKMAEPDTPDGGAGNGGDTGSNQVASGSSSSSSSSGGAILGLGLLAVLLSTFMADDDASASFGDYYFNTPQSAYIAQANERGVLTIKETGNQPYQMWIRTGHTAQPMRMTGVSNTGVSGTEVGINLYNSDTFYINTSVAPNVAAEVGSLNLAGKGETYSLSSGWRNDRYFAGLRLSHGDLEVNSIVDNPIVNSALISNAKLRNTQAQLRAGMNLSTGALRFTPSASVQVGTYESSEHVAESPALEATIPSYAQDYTSVQLGLKMTSDKWLSFTNGSKWKPQLKFDSIHTDSKDTDSLTLRQSDKAGALSFNTNAGLRSMPDVVNSMSFGAKVKSSTNDQAEWKFGFAGLEADGEEYYAAMAAYQLRF